MENVKRFGIFSVDSKNKETLWQSILSAVGIFSLTKANTINKMRQNLTDRYLDVLFNKGEIFKS